MVTDDIYYGRRGAPPTDAAQLPLDLSGAIRQTLHDIYEGTISPEKDLQPEMFSGIWETLNIAAAKGYGEAGDTADAFLDEIRHNTGVFAAFKVHSMQHHMAGFLTGSDGRLRSFDEWREDAAKVASHHCGAWLRTEYDTAVKRAHQAAEWHRFEAERDVLPNLRWVPSTAVEPDSVHRQYWGIVRPIGDAFWDAHKPGDRWGCQCSLEATDDSATRAPGATGPDAAPGLAGNPGKTAQLFSQDHGYFPESCAVCPYYQGSGKGPQNRVKDCYDCPLVAKCIDLVTKKKVVTFKGDRYTRQYHSKKTSGTVFTDEKRIAEGMKNKQTAEVYKKEKMMCFELADFGHEIYHRHGEGRAQGDTFDVYFDKVPADLKCISSANHIKDYAKHALTRQGANVVVFKITRQAKGILRVLQEAKQKYGGKIYYYYSDEMKLIEIE